MIFGKNNGEFDFDNFKNDVNSAAEPLVEAVSNYEPNKKKRKGYKSPMADLPETAGLFFQSAADTLDKRAGQFKSDTSDTTDTANQKTGWLFGAASDATDRAGQTLKDAKLDKKLAKLGDNVSGTFKDAKLDKKLGKLGDNVSGTIKDAKLDKKASQVADNLTSTVKNAKLDKKLAKLGDNVNSTVKDAKLDKKLGDLAGTVGEVVASAAATVGNTLKEVQLDKKLSDVADNVNSTVKDAKLDQKFGQVADNVTSAVKDTRFDKKLETVGETVAPIAASVADTVTTVAANAVEAVSEFIKDNKLDKKAADVASNAGSALSDATDRAGQAFKDAKFDKKLADAQLPEKAFAAANLIPGVTVRNPKKAAKQFRKSRTQALKTAKKQQQSLSKMLAAKQKDATKLLDQTQKTVAPVIAARQKDAAKLLDQAQKATAPVIAARQKDAAKLLNQTQKDAGKLVAAKQKDVQKYVKARQKDLQKGNLQVPFVQARKKASPWGRTGLYLAGAGAVYGGLAANNARIWNAIPPLESKLPGESRYFNSRQGLVFYKEAGQEQDGKAPVVFVQGIGAGNHSYEWLQNFEAFSKEYKVYAYDLLGFGNSAKPNIKYTAEVYIKQLTEFLDEVVGQPANIVASSLGAAYAVQVAYRRPELVKKLLLTSPTGINREGHKSGTGLLPSFTYYLLRSPVLGKAIYSLIAGRGDIRHFSEQQMFFDKNQVTDEMVEQYHVASHQPGAELSPPSFFTGLLDAEIGQTLGKLDKPILMFFGKQSQITPIWEAEALKKQNPQAQLEVLDNARLLLHWEHADEFNRRGLEFLGQPDVPTKQADASTTAGVGLGQTGSTARKGSEPTSTTQKVTDTAKNAGNKVKDTVEDTGDKIREAADKLADEFKSNARQASGAVEDRMGKEAQQADLQSASAQTNDQPTDTAQDMSHFTRQAGATNQEPMEAATEYPGDHDLQKELHEHRQTFIGDDETGAALVEDKDKNGVDDRRMGPLG